MEEIMGAPRLLFFFSSRRRHTRCYRDWSSDVCSSDLWTTAQDMVVGVNVVNPMRASVAGQNILLSQLKAVQVRVIRCGISNDDKGIDFAKRAAAQGIGIQFIVGP